VDERPAYSITIVGANSLSTFEEEVTQISTDEIKSDNKPEVNGFKIELKKEDVHCATG
jgi:hypothetical protein